MSKHPVDALKEFGLPMSPQHEAEMRAVCDEEVCADCGNAEWQGHKSDCRRYPMSAAEHIEKHLRHNAEVLLNQAIKPGEIPNSEIAGVLRMAADKIKSLATDAARYQYLRRENAYKPEEDMVRGGEDLDKLCDEGISREAFHP